MHFTHLSTLKLTSINGVVKINFLSFLHEIMLYDDELHWNQMLNGQESNLDNDELSKLWLVVNWILSTCDYLA
jgi:hypothetical protein